MRRVIDRIFPRGALILSTLSFGYFVMGIVRNRLFATTFGAGPELDAYNAAFRIPEIALDVLVAAGLTAPFVPIYSSARHDDGRGADDFARTVLTAAVVVIAVAMAAVVLAAPWLATQIGAGFDAPTRELYVTLVRINAVAQLLFAASVCLGEVLVAHRRFLAYALAPILYTGGIVVGAIVGAERFGIVAAAWGAVAGAVAHLAIRFAGTLRTSFRVHPAFRVRTPAFREFAVGGVSSINFALDYQVVPVSLIGVAFSLAVFPTLSAAYADRDLATFRGVLGRNLVTIGTLTTLAAILLFVGAGVLVRVLLGGGAFGPEDVARTSTIVAAFALSIPFDALAYPLSRGLYATHDTIRQVAASFVGLGVVVAGSSALAPTLGLVAIPLAYAAGMAAKDVLLAALLYRRLRAIGA